MSEKNNSKEKGERPFYELPTHIKPCSTIIKETRLQLSYRGKLPTTASIGTGPGPGSGDGGGGGSSSSGGGGGGLQSRFSSASQYRSSSGQRNGQENLEAHRRRSAGGGGSGDGYDVGYIEGAAAGMSSHSSSGGGGGAFPGIRAVHTQRPKTGTEHDIWGVSSRKRPPSAITLSRLSLDDFDEDQMTTTTTTSNSSSSSSPPTTTNNSLSRIASAGLGKPIKIRGMKGRIMDENPVPGSPSTAPPTTTTDISVDENLRFTTGSGGAGGSSSSRKSMRQVDEATERIKGLTFDGIPEEGVIIGAPDRRKKSAQKKKVNNQGVEGEREGEEDETEEGLLIPAVNYLHSLVNNSPGSERPSKSQVIAALQQVKCNISEMGSCPLQVKHRLLKLIFKLVERNQHDEDVIFWASFVLLHCRIMGNNLTTVFKMVFKASRSKEYWVIIQETEYLDVFMESFGQICPLTQTESMIYGYGTLKFICMEKYVLTRIVELNLIPVMTLHLKLLNYELTKSRRHPDEMMMEGPPPIRNKEQVSNNNNNNSLIKKVPETIFNGVFQLTSILRSVVGEESSLYSVATSGLLEELCNSLEWTVDDIDILSNIVRILSVVSGDSLCCQVISSNQTFIQSVVTTIQMWHSKDDVVVRLTYCLGNLLAHCENMRVKLFEQPACYSMILHLIHYYLEKYSPISEDILIKSIRILANWSLNPCIGREISADPQIGQLLNIIIGSNEQQKNEFSDELLTCVISTLNNTTFYKDFASTDMATVQTAEYLYEYLTWNNLEGRTEVMKVLGNLTRNPVIREMAAEHVEKLLVSLLVLEEGESQGVHDEELLCATVGVLMNIIVDSRASSEFINHNGIEHLLNLMRTKQDLGLNLMICQFLWNIQISSEKLTFEEEEGDEEEVVMGGDGTDGSRRNIERMDPPLPLPSSSRPDVINSKQRLEIRSLIRKKLESLKQLAAQSCVNELQFLELEPEFRSVAERLFEKLAEAETK